jgi:predicted MFS family arabinose efflux permease
VQAALRQLNDPANVAVVPRVVPAAELTRANAALAASSSLARLIGSPLGGVLVAWRGLGPIVVLDTISFAVAAAAIAFVTTNTDAHPTPDGGDRGVRDGIRVVRGSPILGRMLVLHSFSQLAQGCFLVLFVVFVVERIGDDGSGLGLIRGTMAVGGLIGSAIIGRIASRVQSTTLFAAGLVGMGAVAFVFWNAPALTTALWAYVVLFSLSGIPGSALAVGFLTTVQTHTPGHALGRIAGLMGAAEAVAIAFASMVTGTLVDHVPLAPLLDTQASIYVVAGLAAFVLVVRGQPASGNTTDVTGDRPSEW